MFFKLIINYEAFPLIQGHVMGHLVCVLLSFFLRSEIPYVIGSSLPGKEMRVKCADLNLILLGRRKIKEKCCFSHRGCRPPLLNHSTSRERKRLNRGKSREQNHTLAKRKGWPDRSRKIYTDVMYESCDAPFSQTRFRGKERGESEKNMWQRVFPFLFSLYISRWDENNFLI